MHNSTRRSADNSVQGLPSIGTGPSGTGRTYAHFQHPMMLRAGAISVASMKLIVPLNPIVLITLEISSGLRTGLEESGHNRK
jgi:hypothetical protein